MTIPDRQVDVRSLLSWVVAGLTHVLSLFVITCLLGSSGCKEKEEKALTAQERAIRIAQLKWAKSGNKNSEVSSVNFENGVWRVSLTHIPPMPGGHATIEVSPEGKVVRVLGGK